jgi:hypothetical protein
MCKLLHLAAVLPAKIAKQRVPVQNTNALIKVRMDKLLVERGLVPSRERAQAIGG